MMFPYSSSRMIAGSPNRVTIPLRQTCSTFSLSRSDKIVSKDGLRMCSIASAAAARRAAGVAFQAGAVPHQGEVAARAAGIALIAFQPGLRSALGIGFPLAAL